MSGQAISPSWTNPTSAHKSPDGINSTHRGNVHSEPPYPSNVSIASICFCNASHLASSTDFKSSPPVGFAATFFWPSCFLPRGFLSRTEVSLPALRTRGIATVSVVGAGSGAKPSFRRARAVSAASCWSSPLIGSPSSPNNICFSPWTVAYQHLSNSRYQAHPFCVLLVYRFCVIKILPFVCGALLRPCC